MWGGLLIELFNNAACCLSKLKMVSHYVNLFLQNNRLRAVEKLALRNCYILTIKTGLTVSNDNHNHHHRHQIAANNFTTIDQAPTIMGGASCLHLNLNAQYRVGSLAQES